VDDNEHIIFIVESKVLTIVHFPRIESGFSDGSDKSVTPSI
jgi:hypothetical protein